MPPECKIPVNAKHFKNRTHIQTVYILIYFTEFLKVHIYKTQNLHLAMVSVHGSKA